MGTSPSMSWASTKRLLSSWSACSAENPSVKSCLPPSNESILMLRRCARCALAQSEHCACHGKERSAQPGTEPGGPTGRAQPPPCHTCTSLGPWRLRRGRRRRGDSCSCSSSHMHLDIHVFFYPFVVSRGFPRCTCERPSLWPRPRCPRTTRPKYAIPLWRVSNGQAPRSRSARKRSKT